MATIYFSALVRVPAETAWDFLDRYARSQVRAFSVCAAVRQEAGDRVVTLTNGREVRERIVTVDAERMRAVYTVPGLAGADHHQAEMRVERHAHGGVSVVWCTDVLPHAVAERLRDAYAPMFAELVDAVKHTATR